MFEFCRDSSDVEYSILLRRRNLISVAMFNGQSGETIKATTTISLRTSDDSFT